MKCPDPLRRMLAVARAEWIHNVRDRRSLAIIIALPIMLLLLYGYAIDFALDELLFAVLDQDRTEQSAELVQSMASSRYFRLVTAAATPVEIERMIGRRQVGQTVTGSINASVTKTVPGEWTDVFEKFVAFMESRQLADAPRITATEKWRYWRVPLADGTPLAMPAVVPKLSDTPGGTRWAGPDLGAHTAEVLEGLGYDREAIDALRRDGVV